MIVGYVVVWAEGVTEPRRATYEEAVAAVRSVLSDPVIGHSGDIPDGGERTLFWASVELAENDDGVHAAGYIGARHDFGTEAMKLFCDQDEEGRHGRR